MITDVKKWHYLSVTNLSALFKKTLSNHKEDFYCLNCFNSYTKKNKLKEHEEICNNHDSYRTEMPKWVEKVLKCNPGEKSLKTPFAIYLDLECLIKNNNLVKIIIIIVTIIVIIITTISYTKKKTRHKSSGWAMFTRCLFDKKENKLNYYRGKDCIQRLCKKLKECAMKIINYEEKVMMPLTYEENKSYREQKACRICEEKFCMDKDNENYTNRKTVKDQCHYTGKFRGPAHSKCNLNYKVPKDIPIIFIMLFMILIL